MFRVLRIASLCTLGGLVAVACGGDSETNDPGPSSGGSSGKGGSAGASGKGGKGVTGGTSGTAGDTGAGGDAGDNGSGGSNAGRAGSAGSGTGGTTNGNAGEGGEGGADGECRGPGGAREDDPCDGTDRDRCREGRYRCTNGTLVCTDDTDDNAELCNGDDDDCDPETDDGGDESWFGDPCDGPDQDLCKEGRFTCSNGVKTCSDTTNDTLDVCNGADDDCNPSTSDGSDAAWYQQDCDGEDSDSCDEGSYDCINGIQTCSDTSDDTIEVCNGEDDDCDGDDDNDLPLSTCGAGACAAVGTTCAVESCTPGTPAAETCNGLDDDCANGPDDAPPAEMCGPANPGAVNVGAWACGSATCSIDGCITGYDDIDGALSNGCECLLDTYAGTCDVATAVPVARGTTAGAPVVISGTVLPDESDWFAVTYSNSGGSAVGEHWNPEAMLVGTGYLMDVQAGCGAAPTGCTTIGYAGGVKEWDRRYAQSPAGPNGPPVVNDSGTDTLPRTTSYRIRVYAAPGTAPACNGYQLRLWNPNP